MAFAHAQEFVLTLRIDTGCDWGNARLRVLPCLLRLHSSGLVAYNRLDATSSASAHSVRDAFWPAMLAEGAELSWNVRCALFRHDPARIVRQLLGFRQQLKCAFDDRIGLHPHQQSILLAERI